MPAQQSTAGNKPVDNLAPSRQPVFDWLKDHLLPSVVLILLIVIFFLFGTFGKQPKTEQIIDDLVNKGVVFENAYDETRFKEFLGNGIRAGSGGYESLTKGFLYLSSEYIQSPTSEKRETLNRLSQYISKNFPKEAEVANLEVPCREESCGVKFVYSNELSDIKNKVEDENKLSQIEKKAILVNLENAAIAAGEGDRVKEFDGISLAFQELKSVWEKTNAENIKKLAENLLSIAQNANQAYFQFAVDNGILVLD